MADRPSQPSSLVVEGDQPVLAIPSEENGREVVLYFTDEAAAEAAAADDSIAEALRLGGAWQDLDWAEMERALERIGHENPPTPPIDEL